MLTNKRILDCRLGHGLAPNPTRRAWLRGAYAHRLIVVGILIALFSAADSVHAQQTRLEQLLDAVRKQRGAVESIDELVPPADPSVGDTREPIPRFDRDMPELGRENIVPLGPRGGDVEVTPTGDGRVSIVARQANVGEVLELLAQNHNFNLVMTAQPSTKMISITLKNVPLDQALDAVVQMAGLTWIRRDDIILVTGLDEGDSILPQVQNRELRVFPLDYVAVEDVEASVQELLSPIGKVSTHVSESAEIRQTKDLVIVEDLPDFVERIAQYIAQVDQPPRQVMIEARVLQVKLTDDYLHGINLLYNFAAGQGSTLGLKTTGFANPSASPAMLFTLTSQNLNNVVQLLETTLDSKTLANPRVMVVNGQESFIQVGGQLGFRVLTTTQTSTLEQVQFLNTGVILRITPYITRDHQILMRVKPEVSTGQINEQGLPEAQTTTVETQVLLPDGQGMVIGGLIQETYNDRQNKIPVLGDVKWVGRLFQKREVDRERVEVIIALIPRIVPYGDCQSADRDREELARTDAPIFRGALGKNPRPWEPKLYDATENPRTHHAPKPFDSRMRPQDGNVYAPYPTEPGNKACWDPPGMYGDPNCPPMGPESMGVPYGPPMMPAPMMTPPPYYEPVPIEPMEEPAIDPKSNTNDNITTPTAPSARLTGVSESRRQPSHSDRQLLRIANVEEVPAQPSNRYARMDSPEMLADPVPRPPAAVHVIRPTVSSSR